MATLTYGMATAIGQGRKINHDAVFANDGIFMIVDGIGTDGQEIAQLVIQEISTHLQAKSIINANGTINALAEAYTKATAAIHQQGNEGGGASATTVVIKGEMAYLGHVGNTRAYSVARQSFELLTIDHTMEEKSLEFGMNFGGDPYSPVLYRAVGVSDEAPDTLIHPITTGTGILLISDGIYRSGAHMIEFDGGEEVILPLDDEAMSKIIREAESAQTACDALINAANEHGGNDNLSAVFISNEFVFNAQ
ncbi:MAG: hypothetical protein Q9P01_04465 [Anaerolineae bacterium]|nr:hypothetical protein [Anaerolineae bacterium]MDQ7034096.1 hypothetical protein [Anaerolineae bacterium]